MLDYEKKLKDYFATKISESLEKGKNLKKTKTKTKTRNKKQKNRTKLLENVHRTSCKSPGESHKGIINKIQCNYKI